jgi:hypothetical protein
MTFKPTVIVIEPVILKCHLTKDIVEHNNEQIYYFWQKIPVERQSNFSSRKAREI